MNQNFWFSNVSNAILECDKHYQKLQRSLTLLDFFPLSESVFTNLNELQIEHIDQMIYRFTKLQDSMGKKLFPSLYYLLESENEKIPFIDILNHLEKLGAIDNAEKWQESRILRNSLAHEYPGREQEAIEALNLMLERLPSFLSIYNNVKSYISKKVKLPQTQ